MSEFLIYQTEGGKTQISVVLENETLWLSQKQLIELFGKAKGTISEHIKHHRCTAGLTDAKRLECCPRIGATRDGHIN